MENEVAIEIKDVQVADVKESEQDKSTSEIESLPGKSHLVVDQSELATEQDNAKPDEATDQSNQSNGNRPRTLAALAAATSSTGASKKFSSSLSVNKKFLEKTDTAKSGLNLNSRSTPINRINSPVGPASSPLQPTSPANLPQGPRLLSGKISTSPFGQPAGTVTPAGWARQPPVASSQTATSTQLVAALDFMGGGGPSAALSGAPPLLSKGKSAVAPSQRGMAAARGRGLASAVPWARVNAASNAPESADFPSPAEAARSKQLKAHALATALAAKEAKDKKSQEIAQEAAAAYRKHLLEDLDAFRGVHLDPNMHWDEMEDDDDYGDVVDFGDGTEYKIPMELTAEVAEPTAETVVPANSQRPVNEYDRGDRSKGRGGHDRSLFNDRLGKFEPYARPTKPAPEAKDSAALQRPSPHVTKATLPKPTEPAKVTEVTASANPWQTKAVIPRVEEPPAATISAAPTVQTPPVQDTSTNIEEMHKTEMHLAAERARKRRADEEADRQAALERARKKAQELEEKAKAAASPVVTTRVEPVASPTLPSKAVEANIKSPTILARPTPAQSQPRQNPPKEHERPVESQQAIPRTDVPAISHLLDSIEAKTTTDPPSTAESPTEPKAASTSKIIPPSRADEADLWRRKSAVPTHVIQRPPKTPHSHNAPAFAIVYEDTNTAMNLIIDDSTSRMSRNVSFSLPSDPSSEYTPKVRLSPGPATPDLSYSPGQQRQAADMSAIEDALDRVRDAMAASAEAKAALIAEQLVREEVRLKQQVEDDIRSRNLHLVDSPSDGRRPSLDLSTAIQHFTASSHDRPGSPKPVWKVLPRVKLRDGHSSEPISDEQQRLIDFWSKKYDRLHVVSWHVNPKFERHASLFRESALFSKDASNVVQLPGQSRGTAVDPPLADSVFNMVVDSFPTSEEDAATMQEIVDETAFASTVESQLPRIAVVLPGAKRSPRVAAVSVRLPGQKPTSPVVTSPLSPFAQVSGLPSHPRLPIDKGVDPFASEFVPKDRAFRLATQAALGAESSFTRSRAVSDGRNPTSSHADVNLSAVKAVWAQPSPTDERNVRMAQPSNSLKGLMDDFPTTLPSMNDLRLEDSLAPDSVPIVSSESSPFTQGPASLAETVSVPQPHSSRGQPSRDMAYNTWRPSPSNSQPQPIGQYPYAHTNGSSHLASHGIWMPPQYPARAPAHHQQTNFGKSGIFQQGNVTNTNSFDGPSVEKDNGAQDQPYPLTQAEWKYGAARAGHW